MKRTADYPHAYKFQEADSVGHPQNEATHRATVDMRPPPNGPNEQQ